MINPYQTRSSPNTGCSYSFSSAHLATWEGGGVVEEDGGEGERKERTMLQRENIVSVNPPPNPTQKM